MDEYHESGANAGWPPEASPRFFSRALPTLGLLIGLGFVATLFLAGRLSQPVATIDNVRFHALGQTGIGGCTTPLVNLPELPRGELFIPVGPEPANVLISLPGPPTSEMVVILDSSVDRARLTPCQSNASDNVQVAGDLLPFSVRPYDTEDIAFDLIEPVQGARYLLEIEQDAAISQRISVQDPEDFLALSDQRLRIRLMAYGAVSIMILYNLALAYLTANGAFAFNAGVSFSMLALDTYLSGFGSAFLWPEQPWIAHIVLAFGLAGPSLFGPFYLVHFLREDRAWRSKSIDQIWPIISGCLLFSAVFIVETASFIALTVNWIVMTIYYAWQVLRLAQRGNERASVLLFPLFGAVVPAMVTGSLDSWMQPDFGVLQDHLTELALILEALCFTLALAFLLRLSRWRETQSLMALHAQAEAAKQTLLQTLDADRTRMASELHDTAGQGLLLAISQIRKVDSNDPNLRDVDQIVRRTLNDLRALSHDLHPSTLAHLGLEGAISAMIDHASASSEIEVVGKVDLTGLDLSPSTQLHIYRILQELLTNALVHSNGTRVVVQASQIAGDISLFVEDDGRTTGSAPSGSSGIGTTIIQERVRALGGRFWSNRSNQGTTARAIIPVTPGGGDGALP